MSITRKIFLFVALPLVIVFFFLVVTHLTKIGETGQKETGSNASNTPSFADQYGSSCDKNANPTFSNSPLVLEKIAYIEPLGKTADGHVTPIDHVYVAPIDQTVADNTYDVVMPADGRVVQIDRMPAQYIGDKTGVKLATDDFRLVISFSCRYFSIFIHVHKLSDALATAAGTIEAGKNKQVKVDLKAGDLLAHLGGNSFDWTMVDTQTTLTGFITPSLYTSEPWKINTISPFDVYAGEIKASMEAKSLRSVAPLGGKLDWDKTGSLVGNWFRTGTNGYAGATIDRYWDGHLSIAPDNIDPSGIVYSTGNWQDKAAQFVIKGSFKPETITVATGLTKIELENKNYLLANKSGFNGGVYQKGMTIGTSGSSIGVVLVQVLNGEKLKVEQFPGKTADQVTAFTTAAQTYQR